MGTWLAIDTATGVGSVAIGTAGTVLGERSFADRRHAAVLTPTIHELLRGVGVRFADLRGIVLADGPGSFTGLRIGLATVKGIAHGCPGLEFRSTPSMLAAAWTARTDERRIAVWYDALRGEVFSAEFEFSDQEVRVLRPPSRGSPAHFIREKDGPDLVVGGGAELHRVEARTWVDRNPIAVGAQLHAAALVELLAIRGGTTEIENLAAFEPNYGRRAEAQVRWEAEHGHRLPDS